MSAGHHRRSLLIFLLIGCLDTAALRTGAGAGAAAAAAVVAVAALAVDQGCCEGCYDDDDGDGDEGGGDCCTASAAAAIAQERYPPALR